MTKVGAVLLILAGFTAVRSTVRQIALPFEGIERLAKAHKASAPETSLEFEPSLEFVLDAPQEPDEEAGTLTPNIEMEVRTTEWDQWKAQAIAALPEELRSDSDHRRAIDELYLQAVGQFLDEISVDIINRPPVGEYDIGGVGFTDIDERTKDFPGFVTREQARNEVYHLRAQPEKPDAWTAFWEDWKAQAIASLPEAERNDPNYLKVIDTTYEEMVNLAPAPALQTITIYYGRTWATK